MSNLEESSLFSVKGMVIVINGGGTGPIVPRLHIALALLATQGLVRCLQTH